MESPETNSLRDQLIAKRYKPEIEAAEMCRNTASAYRLWMVIVFIMTPVVVLFLWNAAGNETESALLVAIYCLLVFIAMGLLAAASSIIKILGPCSWLLADIAVSAHLQAVKAEKR